MRGAGGISDGGRGGCDSTDGGGESGGRDIGDGRGDGGGGGWTVSRCTCCEVGDGVRRRVAVTAGPDVRPLKWPSVAIRSFLFGAWKPSVILSDFFSASIFVIAISIFDILSALQSQLRGA